MHFGSPSDPSQTAATWLESQKVSQTTTEQGKAEQCIFDFITTWSEFQEPSQSAARRGEAELCILDFKTTWSEFHKPIRLLLSEAKPSYVYPILRSHGQSCITSPESVQSGCVR